MGNPARRRQNVLGWNRLSLFYVQANHLPLVHRSERESRELFRDQKVTIMRSLRGCRPDKEIVKIMNSAATMRW